ncbi:gliding motility-associated ABC transporter permease subunit GldF [Nonlabens ponticola]|uniref:Gliding motility-associated ABC transporter permease subunit GldF n=1 Tax=Nonlabens ponticola TaxID=2496866 RepID=A0A3S9MYR1_9FLAO|nr:gliding motility-associated ABC transporter permease subunit GldF [Nonlabens ponticola]AZQ44320.1 gliding motility-associated ABC transporter permease subunit GldF [Nonlabens ponticola]
MIAIYFKELKGYFSTLTGYLIIALFLLVSGLMTFVMDSDSNLLNYGFADMTPFFMLLPWLFIFLIPAVCMRSFTAERELGTLELLITRPIAAWQLVLGKYLAVFTLVLFALIPTLIYVISIGILGEQSFNLDTGSTISGYLGAILSSLIFIAIAIWCSIIAYNQIVAFLLAAVICFFFYFGFEGIAGYLNTDNTVTALGMKYHYESMARGVIDTRDLIYFISVAAFFYLLGVFTLENSIDKS